MSTFHEIALIIGEVIAGIIVVSSAACVVWYAIDEVQYKRTERAARQNQSLSEMISAAIAEKSRRIYADDRRTY